ncbi:hypothetical protein [Streptomyces mirabilis]|nr:hypothetical protein [Streptomyces mirabilis]MCX4438145.1 hypothetical protein [Streptomyces mirabilis]
MNAALSWSATRRPWAAPLHSCGTDVGDPVTADQPAAALPTANRAS